MALIQKISPVGLDIAVQEFQSYLFDKLGFNNWQCFPRVYMNEASAKGLVPEYYEGNKEYRDVLFDDNFDLSSFFFRSSKDEPTEKKGIFECNVSLIFQGELSKLFPSIDHRADEEFDDLIRRASKDYDLDDDFELISLEHGIKDVYREFNKEQIRYSDMSNRYVVRPNFKVRFFSKCT